MLADSEPFSRAGIDPADVVPTDAPLDVKHCFQRLAAQFAQQRNGSWFGDKDPNLIDYLPALATAFPRARVIHIYRDPRDVVLSKTKAAWSAGRPYWQHALIGELQLRRGREAAREYFRGRCAELAYEDLLADPETTLRGMCEEVGLPYDPAMLAYTDTARELVADSERSWKKETFRPIQKNNVRKWEGNLTDDQVGLIEHLSTTCFEELGYRRSVMLFRWPGGYWASGYPSPARSTACSGKTSLSEGNTTTRKPEGRTAAGTWLPGVRPGYCRR